jgi:hypothetical protein
VKLSCYRHWGDKEERYSSYSFLTSALDGDDWSASRPGRALPPGKGTRYPLDIKTKEVPEHTTEAQGRRCSSYSFMTSALDGGEWSVSLPGRALPPGEGPPYPLDRRLGGPQSRSGHKG